MRSTRAVADPEANWRVHGRQQEQLHGAVRAAGGARTDEDDKFIQMRMSQIRFDALAY